MTNFLKHKMRGKSPWKIAGLIIFGISAILGFAILFGFVIMLLWNWLMPEIFGLATITYWQAVGIFILFKVLLGGFGSGRHRRYKSYKHSKYYDRKKSKKDFFKWKHYDKFWKEEGNQAYEKFAKRMDKENNEATPEQ
jgi:hypothetical protein